MLCCVEEESESEPQSKVQEPAAGGIPELLTEDVEMIDVSLPNDQHSKQETVSSSAATMAAITTPSNIIGQKPEVGGDGEDTGSNK